MAGKRGCSWQPCLFMCLALHGKYVWNKEKDREFPFSNSCVRQRKRWRQLEEIENKLTVNLQRHDKMMTCSGQRSPYMFSQESGFFSE